jgi:hypothetical protein
MMFIRVLLKPIQKDLQRGRAAFSAAVVGTVMHSYVGPRTATTSILAIATAM